MEKFCNYTATPTHQNLMGNLKCLRAVHDPYAWADDPANSYLKEAQYLVYASGELPPGAPVNPEILARILVLQNGSNPRFVHTPLGQIKGIAVDQDYLWVFAGHEFMCATHAGVVRMAETSTVPNWIRSTNLPDGKEIHILYPCDDGTLVLSMDGGTAVYTANYRIDLKKGRLTSYDGGDSLKWTKIRDRRAEYVEKLPVFCWPQFESLRETLEALQSTLIGTRRAAWH
jgi:hypothetical protein